MWNKIQKIYIGDHYLVYPKWKPWSNTLVYYKFDWNLDDSSGNWYNLTNSWTISYSSSPSSIVLNSPAYLYTNISDSFNHNWTLNTYVKITTRVIWLSCLMAKWQWSSRRMLICGLLQDGKLTFDFYGSWNKADWTIATSLNQWYNVCYTYNYTTRNYKAYLNWVKDIDATLWWQYTISTQQLNIWALANATSDANYRVIGNVDEYIIESKEWTAQEIADYYNQTKSNYWL